MMNRLRQFFPIVNLLSWYGCLFLISQAVTYASYLCLGLGLMNLGYSAVCYQAQITQAYYRQLVLALALGLGFDQWAISSARLIIGEHTFVPLWLFGIWLNFIAALPWYRTQFQQRPRLALCFGASAGPLSYYAGQQFQVLQFSDSTQLWYYAAFWSLYFYGFTRTRVATTSQSRLNQ